ncbi:MAG: fibronectin type III domain-containing protein, partial [Trebonia sp.]
GAATDLTATSATINGTDPNGAESYYFDWGSTTSYGYTTPSATAAAGTLSVRLGGLTPDKTYHFRIVSAAGAGSDGTFTTAKYPVTGSATSVTDSTAVLTGTDPNTGESYHFEYGKTTAYGLSTTPATAASGTLSVTVRGLSQDTTYHYRIVSDAGAGSDSHFSTGTMDSGILLKGPKQGKLKGKLTYHVTYENTGSSTIALALFNLRFFGKHQKVKYQLRHGCSGKTATLLCHVPSVAAGQTRTLKIVVRPLHTGTLKVRAVTVQVGNRSDATPKDNVANLATKVTRRKSQAHTASFPLIDSGVAIKGPKEATVGAKLAYHVTYANTGERRIKQPLFHVRFLGKQQAVKLVRHRHCSVEKTTLLCHLPALAAGKKRGLTFVIRALHPGKLKVRTQIATGGRGHDATRKDDVAVLVTKVA